LVATRKKIEPGWRATSDILLAQGHLELAEQVGRFMDQMPQPRTDRALVTQELQQQIRVPHVREQHATR